MTKTIHCCRVRVLPSGPWRRSQTDGWRLNHWGCPWRAACPQTSLDASSKILVLLVALVAWILGIYWRSLRHAKSVGLYLGVLYLLHKHHPRILDHCIKSDLKYSQITQKQITHVGPLTNSFAKHACGLKAEVSLMDRVRSTSWTSHLSPKPLVVQLAQLHPICFGQLLWTQADPEPSWLLGSGKSRYLGWHWSYQVIRSWRPRPNRMILGDFEPTHATPWNLGQFG